MMLDWTTLIQPSHTTNGDGGSLVTPEYVVTATREVTEKEAQGFEYKGHARTCNHVTTETTKTEEGAGSSTIPNNHVPGGEWVEHNRANDSTHAVFRHVIHYRLTGACDAGGSLIGEPGDTLASLVNELKRHYGARLDENSVLRSCGSL